MGLEPGAWMRYSVALGKWVRYSGELAGPVYCNWGRRRGDEQGSVEWDEWLRKNLRKCELDVDGYCEIMRHTFQGAFIPTLDNALRKLSRKPDLDMVEMASSSNAVYEYRCYTIDQGPLRYLIRFHMLIFMVMNEAFANFHLPNKIQPCGPDGCISKQYLVLNQH